MKKIIIAVQLLFSITVFGQGFLHRDGQNIVDGNGKNILLRGLGLGGWMVQEGYMLQTQSFASPQYQIKQKIQEVAGEKGTKEFYAAYKANGITKRDIDSLGSLGFQFGTFAYAL
jgi:endoglucanase